VHLSILFPAILNGLLTGAVYALIALGLTLVYGVLHIINFAHGALLTAALFAASAECGAIAAGGSPAQVEALREYGDLFGVAFQMKDDLLDVTADAAVIGKPVGNDLHERKMTIPLILALGTGDAELRARVEAYYDGEGADTDVPAIVADIARVGALGLTRRQIADYAVRAKAALAPMGASEAKTELERLADALVAD